MKGILKHTLLLAAITIVSGLCLGFVYELTKAPIAQAKEAATQEAYKTVFKEADSFEAYQDFDEKKAAKAVADIEKTTIDDVVVAKSGSDEIGYVITVTDGNGYGGDIQFTVGIQNDGTITGVSFLSISESPGLGMEAKEDPDFLKQYVGKQADEFTVTKTGSTSDNEIDALSGATITSKAVTGGVNASLKYFQSELGGGSGNE